MASSSHLLSIAPNFLSLHRSSSLSSSAPTLFAPPALKSSPKLLFVLSSINNYTQPISRFVRKVSISSELVEEDDTLDFSGPEAPTFQPGLKLFVGNLPFSADSAALAGLFEQAGGVELVEVIYDKATGRSRGFGFVTMSTAEEAEAAVQQFNGYELEGRAIRVSSGPPPPKRENSSFGEFRGRERTITGDTNRLYVGNLSWNIDNLALETLFREQGNVKDVRVVYDRESGRSRGFGFVTYNSAAEANNAIRVFDGTDLDGRSLRISHAESRRPLHPNTEG